MNFSLLKYWFQNKNNTRAGSIKRPSVFRHSYTQSLQDVMKYSVEFCGGKALFISCCHSTVGKVM